MFISTFIWDKKSSAQDRCFNPLFLPWLVMCCLNKLNINWLVLLQYKYLATWLGPHTPRQKTCVHAIWCSFVVCCYRTANYKLEHFEDWHRQMQCILENINISFPAITLQPLKKQAAEDWVQKTGDTECTPLTLPLLWDCRALPLSCGHVRGPRGEVQLSPSWYYVISRKIFYNYGNTQRFKNCCKRDFWEYEIWYQKHSGALV